MQGRIQLSEKYPAASEGFYPSDFEEYHITDGHLTPIIDEPVGFEI